MYSWMGTYYGDGSTLLVILCLPYAAYHFACQLCSPLLKPFADKEWMSVRAVKRTLQARERENHA